MASGRVTLSGFCLVMVLVLVVVVYCGYVLSGVGWVLVCVGFVSIVYLVRPSQTCASGVGLFVSISFPMGWCLLRSLSLGLPASGVIGAVVLFLAVGGCSGCLRSLACFRQDRAGKSKAVSCPCNKIKKI